MQTPSPNLTLGSGPREVRTRHNTTEFVRFLEQATRGYRRKEIHIFADDLSAHKTPEVQALAGSASLGAPALHADYSSWLNQVELWFSNLERDCIARGIFPSTFDRKRKLVAYIKLHNVEARPFLWTYRYRNAKRRIRVTHQ